MKSSFKLVHLLSLIISALILYSFNQPAHAASIPQSPILQSPAATIYNPYNGQYVQGPYLPSSAHIVRLAYQGTDITSDTTVNNQPVYYGGGNQSGSGIAVATNSIIRIKNVGTLKGKPLTIAIQPNQPSRLTTGTTDTKTSILLYNAVSAYEQSVNIWVEDANNNQFYDPEAFFIFNFGSEYSNSLYKFVGYEFTSRTAAPTLMAPNNIPSSTKVLLSRTDLSNAHTNTFLKEEGAHKGSRFAFSYGFLLSPGNPLVLKQSGSYSGMLNSLLLFDKKDMAGVKVPFQPPSMIETKNNSITGDNAFKAQLKIVQQTSAQSFLSHYPQNLNIAVDLGSYIKKEDIVSSDIKVYDMARNNITNKTLIIPPKDSSDGKLHVLFARDHLNSVGDNNFTIEGMLPLNSDHPDFYSQITSDNYIKLTDVSTNHNEHPGISRANMFIKIPGPSGEAVKDIVVLQDTYSQDLVAKDLVTNLSSHLPKDIITVEKIIENKYFTDPGTDFVTVLIKSSLTGITSEINVPITVISKDSMLLESMNIIPEPNQIATNKEQLIYKPSFNQIVKESSNTSSNIDDVELTISYADFLIVETNHFSLFAGNELIPIKDYSIQQDVNDKTLTFTLSNVMINRYLGQTFTIRQLSTIATDDKNIMNHYDSIEQKFTFPITAYHRFGFLNNTQKITQNPITENKQVIQYKPFNTAISVPEETLPINSPVKEPKDYLINISSKDFEFDNQVIEFEQQPDFSTPGKKEFNVLIKSPYFGIIKTIPVVMNIEEPTVEMQLLQVYDEDYSVSIFNDIDTEQKVNNETNLFTPKVGQPLVDVLKEIFNDPKNQLNLNYSWYNPIDYKDYVIYLDGETNPTVTSITPNKKFKLYLGYTGKIDIDVTDIAYNHIQIADKNNQKHPNPQTDQVLKVINTTLNDEWHLTVGLPDGIKKNTGTKENFIGGLFTPDGQQIPTDGSSVPFFNQTNQQNIIKEVHLNIELRQDLGNSIGGYSGSLLWSLNDTP